MKITLLKTLLIIGLVVHLSACSSSEKKEDGSEDNPNPPIASDAGTDAVPKPSTEGDQAAAAPNPDSPPTPAPDASAPPTPPPSIDALASPSPAPTDTTMQTPPPSTDTTSSTTSTGSSMSSASTGSGNMTDYTVQTGDTLMKIAFETYGDVYKWKNIYEANKDKLSDANVLPKGTVLKLESPSTPASVDKNGEKYLIKSGDTLGKISGEVYGTPSKWRKIWENNKQLIRDPNKIFAGFYLYYLPDGSGGANLASSQPAQTNQMGAQAAPAQAGSAQMGGSAPGMDNSGAAPAVPTLPSAGGAH